MSPAHRGEADAPTPALRRGSLLDRVAHPDTLLRAFEHVRNTQEASADPMLASATWSDPLELIAGLRASLIAGVFRPGKLRSVDIPKGEGDVRTLQIPTLRDRIVERAIHDVLVRVLDPIFTPWSFGYRPAAGIADAVQALAVLRDEGNDWVVRCDFSRCFESIPKGRLLHCLGRYVSDHELLVIIRQLLLRETSGRQPMPSGEGLGIAQGAPLSPLLCNVYLHDFDLAMLSQGTPVVRFADDLAVAAAHERGARAALRRIERAAQVLRLKVAEAKTIMTTFTDGVSFLGIDINANEPSALAACEIPDRKTVYVTRQGAALQARNGQIRVVKGNDELLAVPISQVEQIVTFGSVGISAGLRELAFAKQVDVVLCSRSGAYRGRILGPRGGGVHLRREQYRRADDPEFRLALAQRFVAGKLANQRALLLRYARRRTGRGVVDAARYIEGQHRESRSASSVASLRGIEGSAARRYFEAFARLVPNALGFDRRVRRPPTDPVNAALSFGYSLLTGWTGAALEAAGLDHQLGFLHVEEDGRPALALDLMEEFRPLIIDAVVVESFRRKVLTAESFVRRDSAVLLSDQGRRRFVGALEERMLTRFGHAPTRQRTTYRRALFLQARAVANAVRREAGTYEPVRWR